jgi:hypothetical protein
MESIWLTLGGLVTLLMTAGYDQVSILQLQRLPAGPAALMTAARNELGDTPGIRNP